MYTSYFLNMSHLLFDPNNPTNTLLQIEVIFNIENTIYTH